MGPEQEEKRLRIIRVSRKFLVDIFSQGPRSQILVACDMPYDAKLVGVSDQLFFDSDDIALKFESHEFAPVPKDGAIPVITFEAKRVNLWQEVSSILERQHI